MTRVVVIGDSQAGAFKDGWDEVGSQYPGVRLEVFAAPVPHFSRLRLTPKLDFGFPPSTDGPGPKIVERINGRASVALGSADVVVWAGYRTGFDVVAHLLAGSDVDGLRNVGAPGLVSEAAFASLLEAMAQRFVPTPPWVGWTERTLILAARPLPAEGCRTTLDQRFAMWRTLAEKPEGVAAALERYTGLFSSALAACGIGFLPQPQHTIMQDILSADTFSRGSRRVVNSKLHRDTDYVHMNAEYGKACIAALVAQVSALPRAPQPIDA